MLEFAALSRLTGDPIFEVSIHTKEKMFPSFNKIFVISNASKKFWKVFVLSY